MEARITINGKALTDAQAMTLRVALGLFLMDLNNEGAFGMDKSGEDIRRIYLEEGRQILRLIGEVRRT